jgi:hypothetical protein
MKELSYDGSNLAFLPLAKAGFRNGSSSAGVEL